MSQHSNRITFGMIGLLLVVSILFLLKGQAQPADNQAPARYQVTDSAGRQVEIPRRPQRVIVLNASNLELFYAVGGTVVGRPTTEALPEAVKAAVRQVPAIGITPNPNIEQIVALRPDLILGVNMPFHHNLIPVLNKAGIPILLQALENYQQIIDTLHFYGELTGQPEQAAAVIAGIEARYETVVKNTKNHPAPKVVIVWGSPESFHMATARSFTGDLVKRLGAVNVADAGDHSGGQMGYVPLSMEYVAKQNPDKIFLITHSPDEKTNGKIRNDLVNHPAWRGLKAVATNQVHLLPYNLFAVNPGTQVGEALTVLAGFLYPEVTQP
ncbi:ABC transporter substrate-binding protein [Sporomusa termitida]|uniref:Vitamin B12-binding protein n=1 Tax=Sporomusa termitida TaxID=2377 RepID=A0A517DNN6_9FIRM|nr:ABC transporter substrate-binding protein [Sporomusa termitida]QDR78984.1 Vitamin B12-binding protein [Sporomusa termitida]